MFLYTVGREYRETEGKKANEYNGHCDNVFILNQFVLRIQE